MAGRLTLRLRDLFLEFTRGVDPSNRREIEAATGHQLPSMGWCFGVGFDENLGWIMRDPDKFEEWAIGTDMYSPEEFEELTAVIVLWLAEPGSGGSKTR